MKENSIRLLLSNFLGHDVENSTVEILEPILEHLPYIGKVFSIIKMNRLENRIKKLEGRIHSMTLTMNEKSNELLNEFIRNRAFPIFINELLEEHEEEKIDFIMYGIEYIYENDIKEENKILIYYDVLRELRVDELKRLYQFTNSYKRQPKEFRHLDLNFSRSKKEREKYQERQGYRSYIDNHLEKLNLIDTGFKSKIEKVIDFIDEKERNIGYRAVSPHLLLSENTEPTLTDFGNSFIRFFGLEIKIQYLLEDINKNDLAP